MHTAYNSKAYFPLLLIFSFMLPSLLSSTTNFFDTHTCTSDRSSVATSSKIIINKLQFVIPTLSNDQLEILESFADTDHKFAQLWLQRYLLQAQAASNQCDYHYSTASTASTSSLDKYNDHPNPNLNLIQPTIYILFYVDLFEFNGQPYLLLFYMQSNSTIESIVVNIQPNSATKIIENNLIRNGFDKNTVTFQNLLKGIAKDQKTWKMAHTVSRFNNLINTALAQLQNDQKLLKLYDIRPFQNIRAETDIEVSKHTVQSLVSTLQTIQIPFYVYEDEATTMNGFHTEMCEFGQQEDTKQSQLFLSSSWRTYNPKEAKLFVILIPYHQSFFCTNQTTRMQLHRTMQHHRPTNFNNINWTDFDMKWKNKWQGRTHLDRLEIAVAAAKKHMDMNPTIPHLMPAFGWHISGWNYLSSIGNRMESEKMFPMKHWKTLNNLILLRFEVYGMSPNYNSFNTGKLKHRLPISLFNVPWETTKHAMIVPYMKHTDLTFVQDPISFQHWNQNRNIQFWYHSTAKNSSHGGSLLRHLPMNYLQLFDANDSVGFDIPRDEWIQGWSDSKFCLIIRGDTPSSHAFTNALLSACIPIIINNHFVEVALPHGTGTGATSWLDLNSFSFILEEKEVLKNPSRIVEIVQESSEKLVEKKLKALLEVRKLLLYEHPESLVVKTLVWEQVKKFQITTNKNKKKELLAAPMTHALPDNGGIVWRPKQFEQCGINEINDYDCIIDPEHPNDSKHWYNTYMYGEQLHHDTDIPVTCNPATYGHIDLRVNTTESELNSITVVVNGLGLCHANVNESSTFHIHLPTTIQATIHARLVGPSIVPAIQTSSTNNSIVFNYTVLYPGLYWIEVTVLQLGTTVLNHLLHRSRINILSRSKPTTLTPAPPTINISSTPTMLCTQKDILQSNARGIWLYTNQSSVTDLVGFNQGYEWIVPNLCKFQMFTAENLQTNFLKSNIQNIGFSGDSIGRELLSNVVDLMETKESGANVTFSVKYQEIDGRKFKHIHSNQIQMNANVTFYWNQNVTKGTDVYIYSPPTLMDLLDKNGDVDFLQQKYVQNLKELYKQCQLFDVQLIFYANPMVQHRSMLLTREYDLIINTAKVNNITNALIDECNKLNISILNGMAMTEARWFASHDGMHYNKYVSAYDGVHDVGWQGGVSRMITHVFLTMIFK